MEEYRLIEGYEVSNYGNCKNETRVHNNGYLEIKGSGHKHLHILVAKAFPEICGEWFEGCVVHHKDRNKLNNAAENLIVLTVQEHIEEHKNEKAELGRLIFLGKHHTEQARKKMSESHKGKPLSDSHKESISDALKMPVYELDMQDNIIREWDSIIDACKYYNNYHISSVCKGRRKSAANRKWIYK